MSLISQQGVGCCERNTRTAESGRLETDLRGVISSSPRVARFESGAYYRNSVTKVCSIGDVPGGYSATYLLSHGRNSSHSSILIRRSTGSMTRRNSGLSFEMMPETNASSVPGLFATAVTRNRAVDISLPSRYFAITRISRSLTCGPAEKSIPAIATLVERNSMTLA